MMRKPTSGISQLELMISLIIMGMIAVLLANALNFNRQALERSQFLSQETEMLSAHHSLRTWVEDMPLNYSGKTAQDYFEGDQRSLRFQTLVTDGTFFGGEPTEFTISLVPDSANTSLVLHGTSRRPTDDNAHELKYVLAAKVSVIAFSYYGRISTETEKRWYDSWSDKNYLPDLVKIEWETEGGTPAPPLTLLPGKVERQRVMSLSSLVPPG
jgi:type II secretory pathway pseudopilin PulG